MKNSSFSPILVSSKKHISLSLVCVLFFFSIIRFIKRELEEE